MSLRFRVSLIACLLLAAGISVYGTYSSIVRTASGALPEELYARLADSAQEAEYFLRPCGKYVGVYSGKRTKQPLSVTAIELSALRTADRALVEKGIPVTDRQALLYLLEDLGS